MAFSDSFSSFDGQQDPMLIPTTIKPVTGTGDIECHLFGGRYDGAVLLESKERLTIVFPSLTRSASKFASEVALDTTEVRRRGHEYRLAGRRRGTKKKVLRYDFVEVPDGA
jgi:hypothetical protein